MTAFLLLTVYLLPYAAAGAYGAYFLLAIVDKFERIACALEKQAASTDLTARLKTVAAVRSMTDGERREPEAEDQADPHAYGRDSALWPRRAA